MAYDLAVKLSVFRLVITRVYVRVGLSLALQMARDWVCLLKD